MFRAIKDIRGQRFGDLTVVDDSGERHHGEVVWLCSCSCPLQKQVKVSGYELRHGHTRSCGCLRTRNARMQAKILNEKAKASR